MGCYSPKIECINDCSCSYKKLYIFIYVKRNAKKVAIVVKQEAQYAVLKYGLHSTQAQNEAVLSTQREGVSTSILQN